MKRASLNRRGAGRQGRGRIALGDAPALGGRVLSLRTPPHSGFRRFGGHPGGGLLDWLLIGPWHGPAPKTGAGPLHRATRPPSPGFLVASKRAHREGQGAKAAIRTDP